ncbi:hypothetical protein Trydic_g14799 [Trypoxylus dichotomus]
MARKEAKERIKKAKDRKTKAQSASMLAGVLTVRGVLDLLQDTFPTALKASTHDKMDSRAGIAPRGEYCTVDEMPAVPRRSSGLVKSRFLLQACADL